MWSGSGAMLWFGWFDVREGLLLYIYWSTYRKPVIGSTDERLIDEHAVVYYTLFIILTR